ncbi:MAG: hypothetical protein ACYC1E_07820 [Propionibacteriaceae bacterium]
MTTAPCRAAHSSSAIRRGSDMTTPVGNWCDGVTYTTLALLGSASTTMPSFDGHAGDPGPVRGEQPDDAGVRGSSVATVSPGATRTRATRSNACYAPFVRRMSGPSATTDRDLPR